MKKLNGLQKAAASLFGIPVRQGQLNGLQQISTAMAFQGLARINEGVTIYPYGNDSTFIEQGYKKNWAVYVVVKKLAKTFSQISWYHYKVNTKERKTWFDEYIPLTKSFAHLSDPKARIEMLKMRKKSVEPTAVTSPLSKFLAKPNRYQSGNRFRGNLLGHKLLTGEGNTWLARPKDMEGNADLSQPPSEMFVIPKANLAIVKGADPWAIEQYKIILGGSQIPQDPANIIMWIEEGYNFDPVTLQHMRGQAPLDAYVLGMQGANEAAERLVNMNKNQGASGFAWNEADLRNLTPEQSSFMRKQFNSMINDSDLAGAIAVLTGKWGFQQIGLDSRALQLLEQQDKALDIVSMIFDVPVGIFKHGTTYENKPQEGKDFIYNAIAPHAYELREEWNSKLISQFGLDRERDVIDCDLLSLPQLVEDLKTQVEALGRIWQFTPNEVLQYLGYDPSPDPNMNKVYIPNNFTPLDQLNADPGAGLDAQMNLLNQ
jgi:HK97 family phage portal protein